MKQKKKKLKNRVNISADEKVLKFRRLKNHRGLRDENGLLPRQALFVKNYILFGFNQSRAAISSGYAVASSRVRGHELLKNEKIRAAIDKEIVKLLENISITPEKVLKDLELTRIKALQVNKLGIALRASELQARAIGLFSEKHIHKFDKEEIYRHEKAEQECLNTLRRLVPDHEKDIMQHDKELEESRVGKFEETKNLVGLQN